MNNLNNPPKRPNKLSKKPGILAARKDFINPEDVLLLGVEYLASNLLLFFCANVNLES